MDRIGVQFVLGKVPLVEAWTYPISDQRVSVDPQNWYKFKFLVTYRIAIKVLQDLAGISAVIMMMMQLCLWPPFQEQQLSVYFLSRQCALTEARRKGLEGTCSQCIIRFVKVSCQQKTLLQE